MISAKNDFDLILRRYSIWVVGWLGVGCLKMGKTNNPYVFKGRLITSRMIC